VASIFFSRNECTFKCNKNDKQTRPPPSRQSPSHILNATFFSSPLIVEWNLSINFWKPQRSRVVLNMPDRRSIGSRPHSAPGPRSDRFSSSQAGVQGWSWELSWKQWHVGCICTRCTHYHMMELWLWWYDFIFEDFVVVAILEFRCFHGAKPNCSYRKVLVLEEQAVYKDLINPPCSDWSHSWSPSSDYDFQHSTRGVQSTWEWPWGLNIVFSDEGNLTPPSSYSER